MHLYCHLTGYGKYDTEVEAMAGAVRFAARCETNPSNIFWAKATLGDLEVLVGTPPTVATAYREAVARVEARYRGAEDLAVGIHARRPDPLNPSDLNDGLDGKSWL
jgi:hypothetical protein